MSNHANRIKAIEKANGLSNVYKYMCVIGPTGWKSPEEEAQGYKIQPFIESAGGTGGEGFYLPTREAVDEFAARPDVDLSIITIVFGSTTNKDEASPAAGR